MPPSKLNALSKCLKIQYLQTAKKIEVELVNQVLIYSYFDNFS